MVPRNSQLILFETYIQHQQFLMTKNSPSIQIYKELKNRILQHLAIFHQNLMVRSEVIRQPFLVPLNPLNLITYKDQFSSHLIHLTILGIVSIHT